MNVIEETRRVTCAKRPWRLVRTDKLAIALGMRLEHAVHDPDNAEAWAAEQAARNGIYKLGSNQEGPK